MSIEQPNVTTEPVDSNQTEDKIADDAVDDLLEDSSNALAIFGHLLRGAVSLAEAPEPGFPLAAFLRNIANQLELAHDEALRGFPERWRTKRAAWVARVAAREARLAAAEAHTEAVTHDAAEDAPGPEVGQ